MSGVIDTADAMRTLRERLRKALTPARAVLPARDFRARYLRQQIIEALTERDDINAYPESAVLTTDTDVKRTYARVMEHDGIGWVRKKIKRATWSYRFSGVSVDASSTKTMLDIDGLGTLVAFILRGEIDEIRVIIRYDDFSYTSLPKLQYVNDYGEYGLFKSLWYDDATSKSEVILKYPITFERKIKLELQNLGSSSTTVEGWFILDVVRSKTLNVTQSGYVLW